MLTGKMLFVLGAGSSVDYGLPTGPGLATRIEKLLTRKSFASENLKGSELNTDPEGLPLAGVVLWRLGGGQSEMRSTAIQISDNIGQSVSIDNYIDNHAASQPLISRIGKAAIVDAILEGERRGKLSSIDYPSGSLGATRAFWMNELFRMLQEQVPRQIVDTLFDNVRFVTFNYDRVLERYFHLSLMSYYGLESQQAGELVDRLDITLVYGRVAPLDWQAPDGLPYGARVMVNDYIDNIKTYTESVDDNLVGKVRGLCQWATTIVFLGFGFHKQNMIFLTPDRPGNAAGAHKIFFSSYDEDGYNADRITESLRGKLGYYGSTVQSGFKERGCEHLLRTYARGLQEI